MVKKDFDLPHLDESAKKTARDAVCESAVPAGASINMGGTEAGGGKDGGNCVCFGDACGGNAGSAESAGGIESIVDDGWRETLERLRADGRFAQYFELLSEWNGRFNLTAITGREDVFVKHFLDSVLPSDLFPRGARVLDVGSGAGFPGVCLALVRPDLDVTLLDSVGKKVTFLEALVEELSLSQVRAVKSRIEDLSRRDFDVVTARAVAHLSTLCEYCLPFLRTGGLAVFYKSEGCEGELLEAENALKVLGGRVEKVVKRESADGVVRSFVVVKKLLPSPPKYPRGGNKPRLSPL